MKVAILYTPGIWNIGNEFINQGAKILIEKVLKYSANPNIQIFEMETLETGNDSFKHKTPSISDYNQEILKGFEENDWVIMIGGSCLSRYMQGAFHHFLSCSPAKKMLLGAGFYENIHEEYELYKDLPEQLNAIFVRDKKTYDLLSKNGKYKNVFNSLDMSFWLFDKMDEFLPIGKTKYPYTVVNIDSPEISDLRDSIYNNGDSSILSWNNPTKIGVCNSDIAKNHKVFISEKYQEYIKLYGGATEVHTNRIHTFAICLMADIPCHIYFGTDPNYHRYYLFEQIGVKIYHDYKYDEEYYAKVYPVMQAKKNTIEGLLTKILLG